MHPASPKPGLTICVAWNGMGDPTACFDAALAAPFVREILVSPMDRPTEAIADGFRTSNPKLRILPPGDTGIYSAWNKLVAACQTTHCAFHGIDDILKPDALPDQYVDQLAEDSLLVCSIQFASPSGIPGATYHHREATPPPLSLGRLANPACPEVVWPLKLIRETGGLDESYRIAGDVDLWFRVRPRAVRVDREQILVTMCDGGASASAKHAGTVWRENRRIAAMHGQSIPASNLASSFLFLNGRSLLWRIGGAAFADRFTDKLRRLSGKPPRYSLMHVALAPSSPPDGFSSSTGQPKAEIR